MCRVGDRRPAAQSTHQQGATHHLGRHDEDTTMRSTHQLPLNTQARAMLQAMHRQPGVSSGSVDAAVARHSPAAADAVSRGTAFAIDGDALVKILLAAMPAQHQAIRTAKAQGSTEQHDRATGRFEILSMRIDRENHPARRPVAATAARINDPLNARLLMTPMPA